MPAPPATYNAFCASVEVLAKVLAIVNVFLIDTLPPTFRFLPIPAPPVTINAPLSVDTELVESKIEIILVVLDPLLVTLCKLLVFQTVTVPVDELTAVSVPAVSVCTPKFVNITLPVDVLTPM